METTPEMEVAYTELRPLLLRALSKLARQGFVVSPSDALDLVHDFFAETWEQLIANFDQTKGTFKGYAYGAFVQFARPRIVRLQHLRNFLVEPGKLEAIADARSETGGEFTSRHDTEVVRDALSRLPPPGRRVLVGYIHSAAPSERMLAKEFGVSRYKLREMLVDALGRVAVALDKPERMPERDWGVALALWRDERTIDEAAAYLGMTGHQVRQANARNVELLTEALEYFKPSRGLTTSRRKLMAVQRQQRPDPESLLAEALKSQGDLTALDKVREQAGEILAALENSEAPEISEDAMREIDPAWIAEVYGALARVPEETAREVEDPRLFYANWEDEASVGLAFRDGLLPGLPPQLREVWRWFDGLPRVSAEEREDLRATPAAREGLPYSEEMSWYGVTPLTVFYATEAVPGLLDRLMRYGKIEDDSSVMLCPWGRGEYGGTSVVIDPHMVVDEISKVTECGEELSGRLFDWSTRAAEHKPYLFGGFYAEPADGAVRLRRSPERYDNLYQRWGLSREAAAPLLRSLAG